MKNNLVVAGHQPNFFPWFGYYEKIFLSDEFIFSDDVQYPKRCYMNRVEVPIDNHDKYLTISVENSNSYEVIYNKKYKKNDKELTVFVKTMEFNFKKYEHFMDLNEILNEYKIVYSKYEYLSDLNIHMTLFIMKKLRIHTPTTRGRDIGLEEFSKNERIVKRCEKLQIFNYLAGEGSKNYHDEELFKFKNINLIYMDYNITFTLFSKDDAKYSILYVIAKYGFKYIRNYLESLKK